MLQRQKVAIANALQLIEAARRRASRSELFLTIAHAHKLLFHGLH